MKLLQFAACSVMILALVGCNSDDAQETLNNITNTSNSSSQKKTDLDFVGFWKGQIVSGTKTSEALMFISETNNMISVNIDKFAVAYGTISYDDNKGTISLDEYEENGNRLHYSGSATVVDNELNTSFTLVQTAEKGTFKGVPDTENNQVFKKARSVSDIKGKWYQYTENSSEVFEIDSMGGTYYTSLFTGCRVSLDLKSGNYKYSEFTATGYLSGCTDSDFNGSYKGVAFMSKENDTEALNLFLQNSDNYFFDDFTR